MIFEETLPPTQAPANYSPWGAQHSDGAGASESEQVFALINGGRKEGGDPCGPSVTLLGPVLTRNIYTQISHGN